MVAWKVVSKQAICLSSGYLSRTLRIIERYTGLWAGAKGIIRSISRISASSTTWEPEIAPPCTAL